MCCCSCRQLQRALRKAVSPKRHLLMRLREYRNLHCHKMQMKLMRTILASFPVTLWQLCLRLEPNFLLAGAEMCRLWFSSHRYTVLSRTERLWTDNLTNSGKQPGNHTIGGST